MKKPEKKYPYPFPDKEALLDYEKNYYLSRFDEGYHQCWDKYDKYHNEEIAKLETQNKRLAIRERELMEQRDKLQVRLNFYQYAIVNLGDTTLYAVEGAEDLKMPTTKSLTKLIDEAEKDYKDLRRFQDKFIKADQELRALKEKVESLENEINYLYKQGDL